MYYRIYHETKQFFNNIVSCSTFLRDKWILHEYNMYILLITKLIDD